MQGPSEFGISGKLTTWDVSGELPKITVPTLVIGATHDSMDPEYMTQNQVSNATELPFTAAVLKNSMGERNPSSFRGLLFRLF